jgi:CHAT domain-containing protein
MILPRRLASSAGVHGLCVGAMLIASAAAWQDAKPATPVSANLVQTLHLNKPVTRAIKGGESHEYQFALEAGQYAHVEVDQKNIDLAVAAFDAEGKLLFDENVHAVGLKERASLISSIAGTYRIQVSAPDEASPAGEYEINLVEVQAANEMYRNRVAGERATGAATAFYYQQSTPAKRQSIQKYQEAAEFWRAGKDAIEESMALSTIGHIYNEIGEKDKALEALNQGLQVARDHGDHLGEARALDDLGYTYANFGDKKRGLELFQQALPVWKAAHALDGEMRCNNGIGITLSEMDQRRESIPYFERAIEISRELHNGRTEMTVLNNLAVTYGYLGELQKELEMEKTVLENQQRMKLLSNQAITLNNIGTTYSNLGDYQKAMDAYTGAFKIAHELEIPQDQAVDLNNIAWIYSTTGDYESALKYYHSSAEISRSAKDNSRLATTLTNLGATYADLRQYEKALEIYQESLALHRSGNRPTGEANTLNNMAYAYGKLGDREKALDYYLQSLQILRKQQDRLLLAQSLRNLGAIYRLKGDRQKAREYLDESLRVSRDNMDRRGEAETVAQMARLYLDEGDFAQAIKYSDDALAKFEFIRSTLTNPKLRAWFSQAGRRPRETKLQTLVELHRRQPSAGYDAAALAQAESARARSLLEQLGESQTAIREGVDPALLDREAALRKEIAVKARLQLLLAGKQTEQQAAELVKEIDGFTHEYDQLQSAIREKSPAYASLTMPVALSLAEIQQKVLDQETLLLEYSLGEDKSFLFAVTPQSSAIYELPKRETIEAAARNVYDLLTASSRFIAGETPQQKTARVNRAQREYPAAASALSHMLLDPVAEQLGARRLLVVGEGALQYIPFTALPDPQIKVAGKSQPLIVGHEVVTAPSASVLALIREDASRRQPAEKLVAVLADPVFDQVDARIAQHEKPPAAAPLPASAGEALRSGAESGLQKFERLRFSRREAEQIAQLAHDSSKFTALDFAASRATATSPDLGQYRIVHFATHGIINNQHPELSGLVLSLVNEKGEPVDGFLRLNDVYNLKLRADLVVLSACQTALGKDMAGEGLIGLTRGFVYAGSPRVVASLWQVDDRVSAELMQKFYEAMLVRKERPAAALRSAQRAIAATRGLESPFYWAAFTIQGEWR